MSHLAALTREDLQQLVRAPWGLGGAPDCVSLVHWVYERLGHPLPKDYIRFLESFRRIPSAHARLFDLVAMSIRFPFADHVGIMLDEREFIHVPRGEHVTLGRVTDLTWSRVIVGYLRHKEYGHVVPPFPSAS